MAVRRDPGRLGSSAFTTFPLAGRAGGPRLISRLVVLPSRVARAIARVSRRRANLRTTRLQQCVRRRALVRRPGEDPIGDEVLLRIVLSQIPDEEVNALVWECLGYTKSIDMDAERWR